MAKAFADNAARVVDWLRDEGVEFMSVGNIAYQQWVFAPRRPLTAGLDWKGRGADVAMQLLEKNIKQRGGAARLSDGLEPCQRRSPQSTVEYPATLR